MKNEKEQAGSFTFLSLDPRGQEVLDKDPQGRQEIIALSSVALIALR